MNYYNYRNDSDNHNFVRHIVIFHFKRSLYNCILSVESYECVSDYLELVAMTQVFTWN